MLDTDEIKFIFVATQKSITEKQGKIFADSFNHFAKIFKNINLSNISVAICVTKTEKFTKI